MGGSSRRFYVHFRLLSQEVVGLRPRLYSRDPGGVLIADVVKKASVCSGVRPSDIIRIWLCGRCRPLTEIPRWLARASDAGDAGVSRYRRASINMTN